MQDGQIRHVDLRDGDLAAVPRALGIPVLAAIAQGSEVAVGLQSRRTFANNAGWHPGRSGGPHRPLFEGDWRSAPLREALEWDADWRDLAGPKAASPHPGYARPGAVRVDPRSARAPLFGSVPVTQKPKAALPRASPSKAAWPIQSTRTSPVFGSVPVTQKPKAALPRASPSKAAWPIQSTRTSPVCGSARRGPCYHGRCSGRGQSSPRR